MVCGSWTISIYIYSITPGIYIYAQFPLYIYIYTHTPAGCHLVVCGSWTISNIKKKKKKKKIITNFQHCTWFPWSWKVFESGGWGWWEEWLLFSKTWESVKKWIIELKHLKGFGFDFQCQPDTAVISWLTLRIPSCLKLAVYYYV